jgi:hypothetical protein
LKSAHKIALDPGPIASCFWFHFGATLGASHVLQSDGDEDAPMCIPSGKHHGPDLHFSMAKYMKTDDDGIV